MTSPAAALTLRPLTDEDDLGALTQGFALGWMFPWWRDLAEETGMELHCQVAELDGRPVGVSAVATIPMGAGGTAPALLNVVPSARRRGVGTALRAGVEETVRGRLPGVLYNHFEGDLEAEAAVAAWGLPVVGRHQESILDLTTLDRAAFAARSVVDGVELRPIGDLDRVDEATWHSLHDFTQARFREAPDAADGGGDLSFEMFRAQLTEPWSLFEALEDGERVGVTFVMPRPAVDDAVNTFFTGVVSEARGRGLAVALKSAQALVMADAGVRAIYTQNMAGNDAILAANRTLGFVRDSGYVDVLVSLD